VSVAGVVDQHVDGAELSQRGLDGRGRLLIAGHVELEREQPIWSGAERLLHLLRIAAGGHDVVAAGERRLHDLGADPARRSRHEPCLAHDVASPLTMGTPPSRRKGGCGSSRSGST
jgi:hypothetical protein